MTEKPKYQLIDRDGSALVLGGFMGSRRLVFATARAAADHAKILWPDQEQDETRSGKGWDIEVVD